MARRTRMHHYYVQTENRSVWLPARIVRIACGGCERNIDSKTNKRAWWVPQSLCTGFVAAVNNQTLLKRHVHVLNTRIVVKQQQKPQAVVPNPCSQQRCSPHVTALLAHLIPSA